jgi:hypothetical protein
MDYASFKDLKSIFVYLVLIIGIHVLLYVTCLEKRFAFNRFSTRIELGGG